MISLLPALPERNESRWRKRQDSAPEAGSAWRMRKRRSDTSSPRSKAARSFSPTPSKTRTRQRTPSFSSSKRSPILSTPGPASSGGRSTPARPSRSSTTPACSNSPISSKTTWLASSWPIKKIWRGRMNYRFSQRTSGSSSLERNKNKRKGTVIIVTLFLFLAFSTLALGLILISQVYLQVGGYEKNSSRLDYCSEDGIQEGFHHLPAALGTAPSPAVITEERYLVLRDDTRGLGNLLLEEAAGLRFPVQVDAQEDMMVWQSRTDCRPGEVVGGDV